MKRRKGKIFSPEEIALVRQMWAEGVSVEAIAARFGVKPTLINWRKEQGVFGDLNGKRVKTSYRYPKTRGVDDEKSGLLIGTTPRERRDRIREIQESWTPLERCERRGGHLPRGYFPDYKETAKWDKCGTNPDSDRKYPGK